MGSFVTEMQEREENLSPRDGKGKEFCHPEDGKERNFVIRRWEREGILSPKEVKRKEFCHPEAGEGWLCPALT